MHMEKTQPFKAIFDAGTCVRNWLWIVVILGVTTSAGATNPTREFEPNDTMVTATAIAINNGEVRGQLSSDNDIDYYVFSSTGGVVHLTITFDTSSGGTSGVLTAGGVTQYGTVITSKSISSSTPSTDLDANTTPGTYYLVFQKSRGVGKKTLVVYLLRYLGMDGADQPSQQEPCTQDQYRALPD
jgi:hypothetical protein